ncbi:MAG: hypothetical protein AAGH40_13310 [Verrucomicrobiota bacterium]
MDKPYVISINAISGGGKTTLTKLVAKSLKSSKVFHFDDFDSTNIYPDDFYDWSIRGANIEEFDCPGMQEAIIESISDNVVDYIVIDFPFGRDHSRLKQHIDLSVFIDTPLDIAMARRIIRDFIDDASDTADSRLRRLKEDLSYYASKARYPYLDTYRHKDNCDLILDGWKKQEEICEEILKKVKAEPDGGHNSVGCAYSM